MDSPHGLKNIWSVANHASATRPMIAKAARCTTEIGKVVTRITGCRRAKRMTSGVASPHGSQDASSVPNNGSHA